MAENLLGKNTPLVEHYSPQLLFAIPRADSRAELGLDPASLPFHGEDTWHGWELSWLGPKGVPHAAVARFRFPCEATNLVESKSFKLYLNSLNQHQVESREQLRQILADDLGAVAGAAVSVELLDLDAPELQTVSLPGLCIDGLEPLEHVTEPTAELLAPAAGEGGCWHSHLLRSLCPVTAQPDWGSIVIETVGVDIVPETLLAYLLGYRNHQEFHEQCVERIFCDIQRLIEPTQLSVQALYTRRGGLDINPWRSTSKGRAPPRRTSRQ